MKKFSLLFLLALLTVILVACNTDTNGEPPALDANDTNDAADANTNDAEVAKDDGEKLKIGALWPSAGIPPVQSKMEAALELADELGVELINMDAQFDARTQNDQAKNLISQQVDGILVDLIDPQAIVPAIKEINEAGIPVVVTTMPVAEEGQDFVTAFVGGDNYKGGQLAAEAMDEVLDGKGGKVVIIEGEPGITVKNRTDGFTDGIEGTGIEILEAQSSPWDRQKALDIMNDFITKYPDMDAVFVQHDSMVPGVIQALKQAGKEDDIKIVGFGATIDGVDLIEEGVIYASPIENLWWESQEGLQVLVDAINGEDVPEETLGDQRLIKKEDLDEYTSKNY